MDSDEAIFGIMGMEALRGQFRAFYHGQDYLGSFQALASIPFLVLLGASPLALRVTAIAEGAVILLCWRRILRKWKLPREAWFLLALLFAFGPEYIVTWTLKSRAQIETLLLGSLWLALWVEMTARPRPFRLQTLRWFALGILTGLGWWTSQLIVFVFLPALAVFVLGSRNGDRLPADDDRGNKNSHRLLACSLVVLYGLTLFLLVVRGCIPSHSVLSDILYLCRWPLLLAHLATLVSLWILHRYGQLSGWPMVFGVGVLLGYMPALCALFGQEAVSSATRIQPVPTFFLNLVWLFLITGGGLIGLSDTYLVPLELPMAVKVAVVMAYLVAIVMIVMDWITLWRRNKRMPVAEGVLVIGLAFSIFLLCLLQQTMTPVPRYAVFGVFFLIVIVALFLARLWKINRIVVMAVMAGLLSLNLYGTAKLPVEPVVRSRMVPKQDQALIDFLVSRGIDAACTSLNSASSGYWDAYRLSFCSGERLIIHPVFHMPRIERYREFVEHSSRLAIVTAEPKSVAAEFKSHGIDYSIRTFGRLTVLWGFDKGKVDELGLIAYHRSLVEYAEDHSPD